MHTAIPADLQKKRNSDLSDKNATFRVKMSFSTA